VVIKAGVILLWQVTSVTSRHDTEIKVKIKRPEFSLEGLREQKSHFLYLYGTTK